MRRGRAIRYQWKERSWAKRGGGSQDTWLGGAEVPRVPGFWNCNLSSLRFTTTTN